MTTRPAAPDQLLDLGAAVAVDGVAAHRPAVDALAAWARVRGIRPVLVDVLLDASAPDVVHERALGRLLVAIASGCGDDRRPCPDRPSGDRQLTAA